MSIKTFGLVALVFLMSSLVWTQERFVIKHSKYFDIKLTVAECDDLTCHGPATFTFYKKGHKKPFQVIKVADSYMELLDREDLSAGVRELAESTAIEVGDFNFDGSPDVAINGSNKRVHEAWDYKIYLFSKQTGKFVYNPTISRQMGKHLTLSELDEKKKVLRTFGQDEQGHYLMEEYSVVNLRMVKVLIQTNEFNDDDRTKVKITTKRLINGKWETAVKIVRPEDIR